MHDHRQPFRSAAAALARGRATRLAWPSQLLLPSDGLWAGAAAGLALLAAIALAGMRRRVPFFALLSVGLLGAIGALISAITLIQVTSFPAVNTGYFSGAYGLWLCFMFTGWLALHETLRDDPRASSN